MRLTIDLNSKLKDIQGKLMVYPEIMAETRKQLTAILPLSTFDFFGMTVAEFLQLQESKMPSVIDAMLKDERTTFKTYIQILNTFEQGAKRFEDLLKLTEIKPSMHEMMCQSGLIDLTPEEAMLNFVKEFFNLHNFEEAQKISLYEYCTAKKIAYNSARFQKNKSELQMNTL
ncbi:hypothetical protein UFOVP756_7 [uncultured Caudovirales phage]|uniref:Uncharacterized protein n=1 Tax=uncultured Caudovirales phage TaxID=2100421 RepID=A0A6J7X4K9_9CAUD|nr:hypothetical protein UFOVP756_7 [uncultured Caudovirales phage]